MKSIKEINVFYHRTLALPQNTYRLGFLVIHLVFSRRDVVARPSGLGAVKESIALGAGSLGGRSQHRPEQQEFDEHFECDAIDE